MHDSKKNSAGKRRKTMNDPAQQLEKIRQKLVKQLLDKKLKIEKQLEDLNKKAAS